MTPHQFLKTFMMTGVTATGQKSFRLSGVDIFGSGTMYRGLETEWESSLGQGLVEDPVDTPKSFQHPSSFTVMSCSFPLVHLLHHSSHLTLFYNKLWQL